MIRYHLIAEIENKLNQYSGKKSCGDRKLQRPLKQLQHIQKLLTELIKIETQAKEVLLSEVSED